jgi:hippurate hydrolase
VTLDGVLSRFPDSLRERLVSLRRAIHAEPELSLQETVTAARLEEALRDIGLVDVRRVASTGLVARAPGRDPRAPRVAIRGDIDALPIQEATGLPYASRRPGVMHACGHDVHAAWAVAAAALLVDEPAPGDVLVVLQPAEETGRGALAILESGALDRVRAIFGGHVDRRFALGQAVVDAGPLAASGDTFEIELTGAGAHAARPHESRDPIVALAAVITALQTIVARRLNPATPGVVTVGMVSAGSAPNIIPDRARACGTVRAVDPESRDMLLGELHRIVRTVAEAYGVQAQVSVQRGTPPIVNPPEPTAWARRAAATVIGESQLMPLGTLNMAAEDFAHYMERIPGCFLRIGAREPGGAVIPAHTATFYPAEESIFIGAAILAECARVASAALARGS